MRPQAAPLHAPGQQHAQRLVRVAAGEAVGDQIVPAAAGEGLDQQLVRRRSAASAAPGPPATRRPAAAAGARSTGRPAGGARGRPDAWSAAACRRHRPAPWGRARSLASADDHLVVADALERAAAARRTGRCRRASSIETKYSSTSPSALPRPSRTRITGASTMVPTFMRYWRVSLRVAQPPQPVLAAAPAGGSARRSRSA